MEEVKLTNICVKCGVDLHATEGKFECQKHPKECKGIFIPKEILQEWAILEKSNKQFLDKEEFEREMILMNATTKIDTRKSTQETEFDIHMKKEQMLDLENRIVMEMVSDLSKKDAIEEAAERLSEKHHYAFGQQSEFYQLGFIEGAMSDASRIYWYNQFLQRINKL